MNPRPLVFVVDDDESVRTGLVRLLRSAGHCCEAFASAEEFLRRPRHAGIGCLLLDLRMPSISGLQLQERLARLDYALPVIFLTGHGDIPQSVQAVKRGAIDFLSKPVDASELLRAIAEALNRSEETCAALSATAAARARVEQLTEREYAVMQGVIAGTLNKQIARRLGISEKTVKVHRGNVMQKMAVTSVADLVRACQLAGVQPAS